jgi:hypothetical protein
MSCVDLQYISSDECIGASLPKINGNFAALSAAVCDLSGFDAVDSPTIDLNWNASTRTLSANASYLLSLINQLSSDMKLEPTSSAVFTGTQTNTVVTNLPAILYSASASDRSTAAVYSVIISSGSTEILRLYPANWIQGNSGGMTSDNPSLPIGGLDCPNGITINATGSIGGQISIGYRLK